MVVIKLIGPVGDPWTTLAVIVARGEVWWLKVVLWVRPTRKLRIQLRGSSSRPIEDRVVITELCRMESKALVKSKDMIWTNG